MPRDDTSYYEDLNPDKASKTGGMTAAELIREIKANFPNLEKDIITEFKVEGRPHSERHGEAISTRMITGPNQTE